MDVTYTCLLSYYVPITNTNGQGNCHLASINITHYAGNLDEAIDRVTGQTQIVFLPIDSTDINDKDNGHYE
jgi:hypothetical protein